MSVHRGCLTANLCSEEGDIRGSSAYYSFFDPRFSDIGDTIVRLVTAPLEMDLMSVRCELLCLLAAVVRARPEAPLPFPKTLARPEPSPPQTFREGIEAYVLANYQRPITLNEIARALALSTSYCCRRYQELTGQTIFQYLRNIRMTEAKRLLMFGIPIKQVAGMVGFEDTLYFSKVFAANTGESPTVFRSRLQEQSAHPAANAPPLGNDPDAPPYSATSIEFRNRTADSVHILWISHEGTPVRHAWVRPGQHHCQQTYAGQRWLVATMEGKHLGVYTAGANPCVADIIPDGAEVSV